MKRIKYIIAMSLLLTSGLAIAQKSNAYSPDFTKPKAIKGMKRVWNDEFNRDGKPDSTNWGYEHGFVRNNELQWYRANNAKCTKGILVIEARKEKVKNPNYTAGSKDWQSSHEFAEYTSSSLITKGKQQWQFGRFEIRARIDSSKGSWPALWMLGASGEWPEGGEIDIMEYHRARGFPGITANYAWQTSQDQGPAGHTKWDFFMKPIADFISVDPDWAKKFHVWKLDWNKDSMTIYLDDLLMNSVSLKETINPDGSNAFLQPQYGLNYSNVQFSPRLS